MYKRQGQMLTKPSVSELLEREAARKRAPGDTPTLRAEPAPELPPGAMPRPA